MHRWPSVNVYQRYGGHLVYFKYRIYKSKYKCLREVDIFKKHSRNPSVHPERLCEPWSSSLNRKALLGMIAGLIKCEHATIVGLNKCEHIRHYWLNWSTWYQDSVQMTYLLGVCPEEKTLKMTLSILVSHSDCHVTKRPSLSKLFAKRSCLDQVQFST